MKLAYLSPRNSCRLTADDDASAVSSVTDARCSRVYIDAEMRMHASSRHSVSWIPYTIHSLASFLALFYSNRHESVRGLPHEMSTSDTKNSLVHDFVDVQARIDLTPLGEILAA